jgi:hypothetical protein
MEEAHEQQMAAYQWGNRNANKVNEQRNLATLAYNIKCKWEVQPKTAEQKLAGSNNMNVYLELKDYKQHGEGKNV